MDFREFLTIASGKNRAAARGAWEALTSDDLALVELFLSRTVVFNPYAGKKADAARDQFQTMMLDLRARNASAEEMAAALKAYEDDLEATRSLEVETAPVPEVAARLAILTEALMLRSYVLYAATGKLDAPRPAEHRREAAFREAWMPQNIRRALAWFTVANVRRWARGGPPVDPAIPGSAAFTVAEDLFGFNVPTPTEAP